MGPVSPDGALFHFRSIIEITAMQDLFFSRNVRPPEIRAAIQDLLAEAAQHRRLTATEIRLRRTIAPRPWRDAGIDRSTWYRRKRKQALPVERQAVAA
jgi:hypothetical protein